MSAVSIGLLIISGLLHASWNFLLKIADEKYVALWWAYLLGGIAFLPFVLPRGLPDPSIWGWLILSGAIEIVYLTSLSFAYQRSDLSSVYPIARGSGPIFITIWSIWLLGERVGAAGFVGILLIITGIAIINFQQNISLKNVFSRDGLLFGMWIGFTISCYTILDGMLVKRTDPIVYSWLVLTMMPIIASPLIFWRFPRSTVVNVIKRKPLLIFAIGALTFLAYTIALMAYRVAYISYAGSIREVGVVFASIGGWLFLKEGFGWRRVIGSGVVFLGIIVISAFA